MTQPNNQNDQKSNEVQNASALDAEAKDQKSTADPNESNASQQSDSNEPTWKDGKPFNPEWAAKKIDELSQELKALKPKAKKADEYEAEQKKRAEAELTEAERLRKQLEETQAQNAKILSDLWRNKAATAANLPSIFAERIKGANEEEMLADAKQLAEALPKGKTAPSINATNPANANANETEAQQRDRLFGKQGNVFDMNAIREAGGGVVWNDKSDNKT